MKAPIRRQGSAATPRVAITPLVDVVFLLLVFFICASAGHLREKLLSAELPAGQSGLAAKAPDQLPLGEVWLKVLRRDGATAFELEGRLFANSADLKPILAELAQTAAEIPVILDVASEVPLSDVIDVYDFCQAAGFRSLNFAVDSPGSIAPAK